MELIVSIGIIAVITVLSLAQYQRLERGFETQSAANELVLALREAQVYGITARNYLLGGDAFNVAHGIRLNEGNNTTYYQFRDHIIENGRWDNGEVQIAHALAQGFTISDICTTNVVGGTFNCGPTDITITFRRPIPHAIFDVGNDGVLDTSVIEARIEITGPDGDTGAVEILRTGVIQITN